MDSLLNINRPPVFCPGCSHERVTQALDKGFQVLDMAGDRIAIVSDIGCSGLFDTFFNTHAMHGLHGRALTYAAGIKLARPELNVVVTMGDGGQGIGGAHLLAACRRNLNMTLLVLNNFNFGMTGGQFSATTPSDARVGSGFLNRLERPLDICAVARTAGAAYVRRCSSYQKDLTEEIARAMAFEGFAVLDIWGICPGRYTRANKSSPQGIAEALSRLPPENGEVPENRRPEYGLQYRDTTKGLKPVAPPVVIEKQFEPPQPGRHDLLLLGNAGQRILTAGEILCVSGLTAGLHATQKNEYNITVLRGPSISEIILSEEQVVFAGIDIPHVVIALSQEGLERRKTLVSRLDEKTLVLKAPGIDLPPTKAEVFFMDFKSLGIKSQDWALAALVTLSRRNRVISIDMLQAALTTRFQGDILAAALKLLNQLATA
jgi:pyruvate/2-oxoacid:ferredoxin oxidoreductase beta subunit/Pyruvate/2-oxoacid:ferredoxin oxidoreductase gamma subunit